ncbi:MAG: hypothetical protein AB7K71_05495 [Polyangiaceae bacterium]
MRKGLVVTLSVLGATPAGCTTKECQEYYVEAGVAVRDGEGDPVCDAVIVATVDGVEVSPTSPSATCDGYFGFPRTEGHFQVIATRGGKSSQIEFDVVNDECDHYQPSYGDNPPILIVE